MSTLIVENVIAVSPQSGWRSWRERAEQLRYVLNLVQVRAQLNEPVQLGFRQRHGGIGCAFPEFLLQVIPAHRVIGVPQHIGGALPEHPSVLQRNLDAEALEL